MSIPIIRQDSRYNALKRGHNSRWPASEADSVHRIELCDNAADAAETLQRIVNAGLRPTVRSGGHCYEDFVAVNPNGILIDLSMLNSMNAAESGHRYRVDTGVQLGEAYASLYKRYGVTLPGGTCYTVAAGGHISGGGYGLLSRLHGLTVDWLSAIDILTVDRDGHVALRRIDHAHDPDLFRACRGAGGGNFGVITSFFFDELPKPPQEIVTANISFSWADMTPERLEMILTTYGNYWETRGKDPDTWGLFSVLVLSHRAAGRFGISVQFCNPDGTCRDLQVLTEFMDLFHPCKPITDIATPSEIRSSLNPTTAAGQPACWAPQTMTHQLWLDATVQGGGSGGSRRAKYKSTYMKRTFTKSEVACLFKHMTRTIPGINLNGSMLLIDSYGGAINRKERVEQTAIPQRSSVMKLQFISYWSNEADDAGHLQWISDLYKELYSDSDTDPKYKETPYPGGRYEGCYINYPDKDMLAYPFWPNLYYGDGSLYPFLQDVKRRYDPHNVFHHAMSIRP
jgi:FAD/FMN-containing dehydrogenase